MMDFIDGVLEPSLWFLAEWSLRWALLIVVLAAWLVVARPRRSATRYLVCLLVLLAGLVLPAMPRWGTGFAIPSAKPTPPSLVAGVRELPAEVTPLPEPGAEVFLQGLNEAGPAAAPAAPDRASANDPARRADVQPAAEPLGRRRIIILTLAVFWTAGAGFLLARRVGGWLLLGRMRRTAVPVPGASVQMLQACRAQLGLPRRVTLAAHASVRCPLTLGFYRPTILVPPSWTGLPEQAQRGSLVHELAHLARYDDWLALVLEVVRVVFFFHPLLHWLLGRIEYERELLCDETAVAQGIDPRDYARMLLEFSRQAGRLLPAVCVGPSYPVRFGHVRTVKTRIHRLLENDMNRWMSPLPARRAIALGTIALAFALGLGSFRVRALEAEVNARPPSVAGAGAAPQEGGDSAKAAAPAARQEGGPSANATYRVEPYHVLKIRALGALPDNPIAGDFLVEPGGKVDLGPAYGKVSLAGLTLEESEALINNLLKKLGLRRPAVSVTLAGWVTKWLDDSTRKAPYHIRPFHLLKLRVPGANPNEPIAGAYLVEPGGKINLGPFYGRVVVAGLTLEEAQAAVENHLKKLGLAAPKASVTLAGWENDWHDLMKEGAGPTDKIPKSGSRKGSLSYGSKSFAEWRAVLTTELKPEVRMEAIKALSAFGVNGYGEEAASAILEAMRGYDITLKDADDAKLIDTARSALAKIGHAAVPALAEELKHGKTNGRRFAISALASMGRSAKPAAPAVIEAFKDEDPYIRQLAFEAVHRIDQSPKFLVPALTGALKAADPDSRRLAAAQLAQMGPNAKPAIPALIAALKDDNTEVRLAALRALQQGIGPKASGALPALLAALKDDNTEVRLAALRALQGIGPKARDVLPALLTAMKDKDDRVREIALEFLGSFGPEAKEAVPALIEAFKDEDIYNRITVVRALGNIGPAAKQAVPVLTDFVGQQAVDSPLLQAVHEALRKINK